MACSVASDCCFPLVVAAAEAPSTVFYASMRFILSAFGIFSLLIPIETFLDCPYMDDSCSQNTDFP